MLDCFPQSVADVRTALTAYRAIVDEFDEVHVAQAVRRFLGGQVERGNHAFAPSCPEFAIEVRKIAEREALEAKRKGLEERLKDDLARLKGGDLDHGPASLPPRIMALLKGKTDASTNR